MPDFLDSRILKNKFGVKLTFAFRCAIYADHLKRGTSYPILARAFVIHEQTVSKICRSKATKGYHDVFAEFDRLGLEVMWKRYVQDTEQVSRIDNAAYEYRLTASPGGPGPQQDTGPGKYWIDNYNGDTVVVNIRSYDDIKSEIDFEVDPKHQCGFWYKNPKLGWVFADEEPFSNVAEALRYFYKYPPRWS